MTCLADNTPAVKGLLAATEIAERRAAQQFGLQRAVEAFVLAQCLGMVRAAVAEADAKAQQLDTKRRVRHIRVVAPGRAVVDNDPLRLPATAECRPRVPLHRLALLVIAGRQAHRLKREQSSSTVNDWQATPGQRKMTLKVHLPDLVWPQGLEALEGGRGSGLPQGDAIAPQGRRHRRWRRHIRSCQIGQPAGDLAPAPAGIILTRRQNRGLHSLRCAPRTRPGSLRTVLLTPRPRSRTAQPLATRIAADPETAAQRRDIRIRLSLKHHKLQTQVHNRHLRPRHRAAPLLTNPMIKCVTYVTGPHRESGAANELAFFTSYSVILAIGGER